MPPDATTNLSSAAVSVRTPAVATGAAEPLPARPARPARVRRGDRRVSVAVLVDLQRDQLSGGHVKCWERFAEAAAGLDEVDLTLYVLGRRGHVESLAPNVRFVSLAPVLSTRLVTSLVGGVDNSDLAPYSPALARRLPGHDVWHATHSLAFAATAVRLARTVPTAMITSVHTDVPMLTGVYTQQLVDRLGAGPGWPVAAPRPGRRPRGCGHPPAAGQRPGGVRACPGLQRRGPGRGRQGRRPPAHLLPAAGRGPVPLPARPPARGHACSATTGCRPGSD